MNELFFDQEGRDKLISGIVKISRAVKSTLGPLGNTVILESQTHTRGLTVTKDGVTVAKAINLEDPVENLAVRMVKEAADRTATSAGDGTTTAIVLTEAIVLSGMELLYARPVREYGYTRISNTHTRIDGYQGWCNGCQGY